MALLIHTCLAPRLAKSKKEPVSQVTTLADSVITNLLPAQFHRNHSISMCLLKSTIHIGDSFLTYNFNHTKACKETYLDISGILDNRYHGKLFCYPDSSQTWYNGRKALQLVVLLRIVKGMRIDFASIH